MRTPAGAQRAHRGARALSALATVSIVSGAILVLLWARPVDTTITPEAHAPTRAQVIPSTVPPRLAPSAPEAPPPSEQSSVTPLIDSLPPIERGAAVAAPEWRPAPVSMKNTAFDTTSFPVRPIGIEDDGQLEVPDETEIGWYQYGSTAGAPGATVLAAHVSWNDTVGPFFELGRMELGDQVIVALEDGTERIYEVVERARYDKTELPRERIWRTTGDETLVLITCGGDFNPEIRRYEHNVVVYAVPVG